MKLINAINQFLIMPIADRVMHTKIMYYLSQINDMQSWTPGDIKNWQNDCLNQLISHVYDNVTYYRNVFNDLGIGPSDIKSLEDLKIIPILKKKDIFTAKNCFVPKNITRIKYKPASTGGSMGDPLKYLHDLKSWSFTSAMRLKYWGNLGYRLGDKHIALGSSSLFPVNKRSLKHDIYYLIRGKVSLNAMNLSDEIVDEYLRLIISKKIEFIYGYASAVYILAVKAIEKNIEFPRIKACITTSEILLDVYRDTIKNAFNCPVMDTYGAGDGGITAYEMEKGFYHVGYNCLTEIYKKSRDEQSGKLLVTDLLNYATPFIRYEIGDEVINNDSDDRSKHYNGQVISKIFGRVSDIIRLENGHILTGPGFTILFKDLNVSEYRIKKSGKLCVECDIKKGKDYTKSDEHIIYSTLKKHAGDNCDVKINYVNNFSLLPSGKRNYFISELT